MDNQLDKLYNLLRPYTSSDSLYEVWGEVEKLAAEARKEEVKKVLQDVKRTLAVLMIHGGYCDDWECGKVTMFIDELIGALEKNYKVQVD